MAIITLDKKTISLKINMCAEESFAPTEEVQSLASRAFDVNHKRLVLEAELTQLLEDCHAWNLRNDENYKSNFESRLANKQESPKSSNLIG